MSAAENEIAIKNATPALTQERRFSAPRRNTTTRKTWGNDGFPSGGAPGGATWSEIRDLIARCEDLPEGIREQLVAMGDRCRMKLNKVSPNDVG